MTDAVKYIQPPVSGFAVWDEEHTATMLYCPPCFISEHEEWTDVFGKFVDEMLLDDRVDWLHVGGPVAQCHVCTRAVN